MAKFAAPAVFILVVIATCIVHGSLTNSWGRAPSFDKYNARLHTVPTKFGEWESDVTFTEELRNSGLVIEERDGRKEYRFMDDLKHHGIHDYIYRVYRKANGIENFQVLLVCGDAGHIAAHSPDVCYRGEGFTTVEDPKKMDFTTRSDGPNRGRVFPLLRLKLNPPKTRVTNYELEIRWAWIPPGTGQITVAENPRFKFASLPALYKVYVIQRKASVSSQLPTSNLPLLPGAAAPKASEFDNFLELLLPRLESALKDPEPAEAS